MSTTDQQAELRERLIEVLRSHIPGFRKHYLEATDAILPIISQHVEQRTAALEAEVAQLQAALAIQQAATERVRGARDAALEALNRYGRHRGGCEAGWWPDMECRCGLDKALAAAPPAERRCEHCKCVKDGERVASDCCQCGPRGDCLEHESAEARREAERAVVTTAQEFYRLREDLEHTDDALTDEQIEACNAAYDALGAALARLDSGRAGGE